MHFEDKTGTLTQNRMDVERVYINHTAEQDADVAGPQQEPGMDVKLFLYGATCSTTMHSSGAGQVRGTPWKCPAPHGQGRRMGFRNRCG